MEETYDPKFKKKNCPENAQMAVFCTTRLYSMNNGAGYILNWLTGLRSAETRTRVTFQSGIISNCKWLLAEAILIWQKTHSIAVTQTNRFLLWEPNETHSSGKTDEFNAVLFTVYASRSDYTALKGGTTR
jgi:hypothetical protein